MASRRSAVDMTTVTRWLYIRYLNTFLSRSAQTMCLCDGRSTSADLSPLAPRRMDSNRLAHNHRSDCTHWRDVLFVNDVLQLSYYITHEAVAITLPEMRLHWPAKSPIWTQTWCLSADEIMWLIGVGCPYSLLSILWRRCECTQTVSFVWNLLMVFRLFIRPNWNVGDRSHWFLSRAVKVAAKLLLQTQLSTLNDMSDIKAILRWDDASLWWQVTGISRLI